MKQLSILFFLIVSFNCNSKPQAQNVTHSNLNMELSDSLWGEKLVNTDFLKYVEQSSFDSLKTNLISNFDIYDEANYKIAFVDAEELAEFNFDFFLPQLKKVLEKRNVSLNVELADDYQTSNDIIINGEKLNLYTKYELDNSLFWEAAARNFFKRINEILITQNLNEQFYLLYGGNDLQTILLTETQYSIICEYFKDDEKEKPYKP